MNQIWHGIQVVVLLIAAAAVFTALIEFAKVEFREMRGEQDV